MKRKLILGLAGLLLSSAPVLAQGDKKPSPRASVSLPGEEKLSAQERAERDFLMPVRRKQAAALKAVAHEEATATAIATDITARSAEAAEEAKPTEATEAKTPATTHRRSYRSSSSRRRHTSTASRKKTVHKSTSSKSRTTAKKKSSRRR